MSQRVLIIFPGALGDLICLLPALRELGRRHAGDDLELMARGELATFAVGRMGVAQAHSIDRPEVSLLFSAAPDAPRRACSFFSLFSAIHCFFGTGNPRLRQVLSEASGGKACFYPFRPAGNQHIAQAYLRAVGGSEPRGGLRPSQNDLACAARVLREKGLVAGQYFLLFPGSGNPAKNWPAAGFAALGQALGRERILVVLGPAEAGLDRHFAPFAILRQPSLGCLAGLAYAAKAFVGNDSGVSHLAAATGSKGMVIFGPTEPARWRPPYPQVAICQHNPLADLTWQTVARLLREWLERADSGGQVC